MGYLGVRALLAFIAVAGSGLAFWLFGTASSSTTLGGVGIFFVLLGGVGAIGILLRWLIYRGIG
jgi:hypothetical protein